MKNKKDSLIYIYIYIRERERIHFLLLMKDKINNGI